MRIQKLFGNAGARQATGLVIVIDVVRAATVEACALFQGVNCIIPVATKEEAYALKKAHPEYLLAGEEGGYKINGFDFGNSPLEILQSNLKGKILVHRTSAGTQGLVHAVQADTLIFGSFVTASAILREIERNPIAPVSLVITESEDEVFADYLIAKYLHTTIHMQELISRFYTDSGVVWFLDEDRKEFPLEDLHIALDINRFDFFCKVTKENNYLFTRKAY